jgi:hypothetical protein
MTGLQKKRKTMLLQEMPRSGLLPCHSSHHLRKTNKEDEVEEALDPADGINSPSNI